MAIRMVNAKNESRILPVTFTWPEIPLQRSWPSQDLAGRDGAVPTGRPVFAPRRFQIRGTLFDPDPGKIKAARDELIAYLQHAPIDLYRHHQDSRYIRVRPAGAQERWLDVDKELQVRIDLEALDPYWHHRMAQQLSLELDMPGTVTVKNRGSVPAHPIITITGRAQGGVVTKKPKITNETTGQVIEFGGDLEDGEELVIDTGRFTVRLDGSNVLGMLDSAFLVDGFELASGENELTVEQDEGGSGKLRLDIVFRERWL